jgi:hypothetical protein
MGVEVCNEVRSRRGGDKRRAISVCDFSWSRENLIPMIGQQLNRASWLRLTFGWNIDFTLASIKFLDYL